MAPGDIEVFETTAVVIEPNDWLTEAREGSRRLVIADGLSDDDIDRLIDEARSEVQSRPG